MLLRARMEERSGITLVEAAIAYPALIFIILAILITATGILSYQEVASLASEGARYAAVHGSAYASTTGLEAATPDSVRKNAILRNAVLVKPSKLTTTVSWTPDNSPGSSVTVAVSYEWSPVEYLSPVTMRSEARMTISN
jgi:Flp pilus assembly protein TadG